MSGGGALPQGGGGRPEPVSKGDYRRRLRSRHIFYINTRDPHTRDRNRCDDFAPARIALYHNCLLLFNFFVSLLHNLRAAFPRRGPRPIFYSCNRVHSCKSFSLFSL